MAEIVEITEFAAPELDIYARLTENQLLNRADPENALFVAESPLVIGRALDSGCVPVSFLMERKHAEGKGKELLLRCGEIPVFVAEKEVLCQLTGFHLTRGMLCAIFRSAAALNIDAVLLTNAGSDPLYRRAARVSMGTVFQVPWTYLPEERPWQELLQELGFQTVAMALREDSLSIEDPRLAAERKLAIVLGTEGDGLAPDTIAHCDYTVRIPMSHGVDSLNVAAASAVAFYELTK